MYRKSAKSVKKPRTSNAFAGPPPPPPPKPIKGAMMYKKKKKTVRKLRTFENAQVSPQGRGTSTMRLSVVNAPRSSASQSNSAQSSATLSNWENIPSKSGVHVFSCGFVPYRNPELIQYLKCSIDQEVLCRIRDSVFSAKSRARNAALNEGQGSDGMRLTKRQLEVIASGLYHAYGRSPSFNMDSLIASKIIVGRWLRPREMTAMYDLDKDTRLLRKRFALDEAKGDQKVEIESHNDERISYAIGRAGMSLNKITRSSRSFYIWFSTFHNRPIVVVYAEERGAIEHARSLINKHMANFKGRGENKQGFHVRYKEGEPDAVSLHAMYKDLLRP